jgi:hypothetical protein
MNMKLTRVCHPGLFVLHCGQLPNYWQLNCGQEGRPDEY